MAEKRTAPGRGKAAGAVKSSQSGSKRGFYILIMTAAVVGIATLAYVTGKSRAGNVIALDPTLPPVTSQGYLMGSPSAPIEVIEFGDFECPVCNQFAAVTEPDIRTLYVNTGKIRFRFIDFPLGMHRNTLNASVAAACADEQGKFWPMHDVIYEKQDLWNGEATSNPDKMMKTFAHGIAGMDAATFDSCLDTRRSLAKVQSHIKLAMDRQVGGTPTFIIGSQQIGNTLGLDAFKRYVDEAIAAADSAKKPATKPSGKATKKP